MKLKPLDDKVLVKEIEKPSKTEAGIILPPGSEEEHTRGKVIDVGSGKIVKGKRIPLDVKKGDIVLYEKVVATEIEVDGETHYIIREPGILGVIDESESPFIEITIGIGREEISDRDKLYHMISLAAHDIKELNDHEEFHDKVLKSKQWFIGITEKDLE